MKTLGTIANVFVGVGLAGLVVMTVVTVSLAPQFSAELPPPFWLLFLIPPGVLLAVGGGLRQWARVNERQREDLRKNGLSVDGKVIRVERTSNIRGFDGRRLFRIEVQWHHPVTGAQFVTFSDSLEKDPRPQIDVGSRVPLRVDPHRPSRYLIELTIKPE